MRTTMESNTDNHHHDQRLPLWVLLAVFSVICFTSIMKCVNQEHGRYDYMSFGGSSVKWALAVTCTSCALATITLVCYLTCHSPVRRRSLEAVMCTLIVGVWGIGLFKILDPKQTILVIGWGLFDLNSFFATWVCFGLIVLLIFSLGQDVAGLNVNSSAQGKALMWYLLAASSLVVVGSAIFTFKLGSQSEGRFSYYVHEYAPAVCKRSKFAIFVGIIGLLLSGTMTVLVQTGMLNAFFEMVVAFVLLGIWCVGYRYIISYDDRSPGTWSGSLYFSSWISFVLIVLLFGTVLKERLRGRSAQQASTVPLQESSNGNNGSGRTTEQLQADMESSGDQKPSLIKTESDVKGDAASDTSNNSPTHSPEWQQQMRQQHAVTLGYSGLMPMAPPLPTASDTRDVEKGLLEKEKGQHNFPLRKNPQDRKKQKSEKEERQEMGIAQPTVRVIPNEAQPFVLTARAEHGERQEEDLPIAIAEPAVRVIPEPEPSALTARTENVRLRNSQGWAEDVAVTVSERIETQPNGLLAKVVTEETLNPDGSKTVKIRRFLRQD